MINTKNHVASVRVKGLNKHFIYEMKESNFWPEMKALN